MSNLMSIADMQEIMGQIVNVSKDNTEGVAVVIQDLNNIKNILGGMTSKVTNHSDRIIKMEDTIEDLMLNSEITETQAVTITQNIKRRVSEILNYPSEESEKYYQTFITALYTYLKTNKNMGGNYRRTTKRNYQNVLDGIEAWYPTNIHVLKEKVDKKILLKNKRK